MTTTNVKLVIGRRYRDTVTGFEGVCTGIARYSHALSSAQLEATDGTTTAAWYTVTRLEAVEPARPSRTRKATAGTTEAGAR